MYLTMLIEEIETLKGGPIDADVRAKMHKAYFTSQQSDDTALRGSEMVTLILELWILILEN